jgi:zinc transporter ZupT
MIVLGILLLILWVVFRHPALVLLGTVALVAGIVLLATHVVAAPLGW